MDAAQSDEARDLERRFKEGELSAEEFYQLYGELDRATEKRHEPPARAERTYVIRPGDTLGSIAGRFGVSVLPEGREDVARRFAAEGRGERFQGIELRAHCAETPILVEAVSWMECRVWNTLQASDHTILIGRVVRTELNGTDPLVYCNRTYARLSPGVSAAT